MTSAGLALIVVSALGCALAGGVFFTFSTFVLPALADVAPEHGITAMQSINVAAVRPWLMIELFGTAAACVAASAVVLLAPDVSGPALVLVVAGTLSYLAGVIALTAAYHQPRNLRLAHVDPASAEAPSRWTRYVTEWSRWNHLRTAAALFAAALFLIGALHV